jgi:hypothetical protein
MELTNYLRKKKVFHLEGEAGHHHQLLAVLLAGGGSVVSLENIQES